MENSDQYYEKLQTYIKKIKSLKEWLYSDDDLETKGYLQKEIDKQLNEMRLLISENTKKK
jgi:hypothetical protein